MSAMDDLTKQVDLTCLADGYVEYADMSKTGINLNEIITGATGCGKTMSNVYSRLLHTFCSSLVVPLAKKGVLKMFKDLFETRGYSVQVLDFTNPEESTVGFNPLDFIHSHEDVVYLARNLVGNNESKDHNGNNDPYWNDTATSVLAAEIELVRLNALYSGEKPRFEDVVMLHRSLDIDTEHQTFTCSISKYFEIADEMYPGNQASFLWRSLEGLAPRTAGCILSIVNGALDKMFTDEIIGLTRREEVIDFKAMGEKKSILFVVTSPMNKTFQNYVNILYSDMFKELFEAAEAKENGRLDVPVHIVCDDFACGSRIKDFEEYISIFRAAGISVSLLLQSESQLASMYKELEAETIINNCDTYIYMGGMDYKTCESIGRRMNKQVSTVLSMPLEQVVVFRRGSEPVFAKRYQILNDPLYAELEGMANHDEIQPISKDR